MTSKPVNYPRLSAELDDILDKLQSSDIDIDEAMRAYERGQQIINQLETHLKTAQSKVTKLTKDFSD